MNAVVSFVDYESANSIIVEAMENLSESLKNALETQQSLTEIFDMHKEFIYDITAVVLEQINSLHSEPIKHIEKALDDAILESSTWGQLFETNFKLYQSIYQSMNVRHTLPYVNAFPSYLDYCQYLESKQATAHRWLDASLRLAMIQIIMSLHKDKSILDKERKEALAQFLVNSIQVYGAYSILLGLWEPDDQDKSNVIEGIRLYHSKLQTELGLTDVYNDVNSLFESIFNEED